MHRSDDTVIDDTRPVIRGHEPVSDMFAESLASGRMHHAWLLTGPNGIGKASMARRAAACLLADRRGGATLFGDAPPSFDIDSDDTGANLVFNGAHPDFLSITPALDANKSGQIKIEQIRALIPFMAHKPARGGWRVAVIDSMDEVNRNGANAMLKLLEEPPEKAVIFLVSSRPGQLPPTIRSRCRVVRMAALPDELCRHVLTDIWPEADDAHLDLLARLCDGAPGRAVHLAESGAADCYQVACNLLLAPKFDLAAAASLAGKWGKGGAEGRLTRNGAVFCLERLLHHAALQANGGQGRALCAFEAAAASALCQRHAPATLAQMHREFLHDAARAEAVYLDFAHFLMRQLVKLHQKTLL
jgi:DNA polymerase-3 subunit delta'